jgi:hypothetical protein
MGYIHQGIADIFGHHLMKHGTRDDRVRICCSVSISYVFPRPSGITNPTPESGLISEENLNCCTTGCRTCEKQEAFFAKAL